MSPPVPPATHDRLREAMERLFTGRPQHTDGKLTKNNLWREAQVSRATMNRATEVLADWSAKVQDSPAGTAERHHDAELADLRSQLRAHRLEQRRLRDQLDAAATVIAALSAENAALRRHRNNLSATVIPISRRTAT